MEIKKSSFGKTKDGQEVTLYSLSNKNGMTAEFIDFGAILVSAKVPDRNGKLDDVILGFDKIEDYETNPTYQGSFIGRNSNRIKDAKFEINGVVYELEKNDGENNLHGAAKGFHKFMYETIISENADSISLHFSRVSPDMEAGFPGTLNTSVTYTLTDENEIIMQYEAVSDKDTIVNLTNHSYFNLAGHGSCSIEGHKLMINASGYTPTAKDLIPTGEVLDVTGTPMDFRTMKPIGQDIAADYEQLVIAGGYDHNFVLDIAKGEVGLAAEVVEENSGRKMQVYTNMPGVQLYSGNFLDGTLVGKGGVIYNKRTGVCFETQFFPNCCNEQKFQSCELKAGEKYDYVTTYKFALETK